MLRLVENTDIILLKGGQIMARYIVQESNTKPYIRNDKMPLINFIPAIVWTVPIYQKVSPIMDGWITFTICAVFLALYVFLSYKPLMAVAPCVI